MSFNKILLASSNVGKIEEFKSLGPPLGLEFLTLNQFNSLSLAPPIERGSSFLENALIKARYYAQAFKTAAAADDSGLCVLALNGAPGLGSARFGGPNLDDRARCLQLLKLMESISDRRAYFYSIVALVRYDSPGYLFWDGYLDGLITEKIEGDYGFGYDPIFKPLGSELTLAQISIEEKNSLSHRAIALEAMKNDVEQVRAFLSD
ncbi:MAG: RdgB/HAM1 family non-canonical purine NTP pyrophosphatase [Deltaproteobacteria bacterium]|jgi:XTP/dITP diphosphohydrolase|nr:RdgB/HAM1 family non-canonical purine NTP pyrophosphatase [Deltaproteobacteria bacterium]